MGQYVGDQGGVGVFVFVFVFVFVYPDQIMNNERLQYFAAKPNFCYFHSAHILVSA